MATSGSYTFDPSFAYMLDEASERAGIDPASINHKHVESAKKSLNLMFADWQARDSDVMYRISSTTEAVSSGTASFALATGAYDILEAVIDSDGNGNEIPMQRISRQDFLMINDKDQTGTPRLYYVDHSTLNAPTTYLWPVPNSAVTIRYDYMRYIQTVGATLADTLDVHRPWLEAVVSGLAARLAQKFNIERYAILKAEAIEAYSVAKRAGSGNSRITISGRGFGSVRQRRRA